MFILEMLKRKRNLKKWNEIIDTMKIDVCENEAHRLLKIEKSYKIIDGTKCNEYTLFQGNRTICRTKSEILDSLLYESESENIISCEIVYKTILCNDIFICYDFDLYKLFNISSREYNIPIMESDSCIRKMKWIKSITYKGEELYQDFESDNVKMEQAKKELRSTAKSICAKW